MAEEIPFKVIEPRLQDNRHFTVHITELYNKEGDM